MSKKNFPRITLRPAMAEDARQIAQLIDMAASGMEIWEWTEKLTPALQAQAKTPLDIGEAEVMNPENKFFYGNTTVVQIDDRLAGIYIKYVIEVKSGEELAALSPMNRVYADLKQHAVGSHYIDSLACYPEFQGRGLGSLLLKDAMEKAQADGGTKLCLLVFEENIGALKLYQKKGFQPIARQPVLAGPHMAHGGDILLLSHDL